MSPRTTGQSRRTFLMQSSALAGATLLSASTVPHVHAAQDSTIQLALVGCGGRGTGAAINALSVEGRGPIKLVAMADVFEDRLSGRHGNLKQRPNLADKVDVPEDRRFLGFDAYQQAMDCLNPGDVVILATPPAFRWVHFTYAIEKGLNVFMEKPVTVDGPTTRRMFQLAEEAEKKNLKVGVGLMVRHCRGRQALLERIRGGEIGDLHTLRAYRMSGRSDNAYCPPNDGKLSEVLFQVRRFHSFLWASGGVYSDYYIHQIDECSWMKGDWPVEAEALGGRHYRDDRVDQNLDTYSVEYTFPDGGKLFYYGRNMTGCLNRFASYAHGTKGCGIVSFSSHTPGKVRTFSDQKFSDDKMIWAYPQPEVSPYQLEWDDLIDAIRQDAPYNEVKRGATASLVTSMGRMAAHTGQRITFEQILNSDHEFAPHVDQLTMEGPAPLTPNAEGGYPVPLPGIVTKQEYA